MSRIDRINELIKREISKMLLVGEIKDPRVKFITIQSVDTSKDLQHARVRFTTLSDDPKEVQSASEGLNSCRGYIRKLVAERVELRYIPEIQFIFDKSVSYLANVDERLAEIKKLETKNGDVHEGNE